MKTKTHESRFHVLDDMENVVAYADTLEDAQYAAHKHSAKLIHDVIEAKCVPIRPLAPAKLISDNEAWAMCEKHGKAAPYPGYGVNLAGVWLFCRRETGRAKFFTRAEVGAKVPHAPGPWKVSSTPTMRGDAATGICSADGLHVTDVSGYGSTIERDMANARLISAAPELLAALQAAIPLMERYAMRSPVLEPSVDRILPAMQDAIAKATA